jgi:hypothetical protein
MQILFIVINAIKDIVMKKNNVVKNVKDFIALNMYVIQEYYWKCDTCEEYEKYYHYRLGIKETDFIGSEK